MMNLWQQTLHLVGSGATAYILARNLCDRQTRPNLLAGFQLAEAGSVPFLERLSERAEAEGDRWLSDQLTRHANDERRHAQIFAQALKRMNCQAIAPQSRTPQATPKPATERRSSFFEAYYAGYSKEDLAPDRIDWAVFFASTHILEFDACRDFALLVRALPDTDDTALRHGLISIADDEKRHAAYLYEALTRRLAAREVQAAVDQWRSRKVDAMLAMMQNFMGQQGKMPTLATAAQETSAEQGDPDANPHRTHNNQIAELTAIAH